MSVDSWLACSRLLDDHLRQKTAGYFLFNFNGENLVLLTGSRTSTVKPGSKPTLKPTEASGQESQHVLFSAGVLAFALAVANIFHHF